MTKIYNDQYHFLDQDIKDMSWGNVDSDWSPPNTFPDLTKATRIAVDLETWLVQERWTYNRYCRGRRGFSRLLSYTSCGR